MFKIPRKFKIHYLIIPLLLTFLLYVFSLIFFFLPLVEKSIVDKKKEMIKELATTVWNIIDFYNTQVEEGVMSLDDAKTIAVNNIKSIRYGKQKKDYFWINDFRTIMIMHPYLPELNNQNLSEFTDPDGRYLFKEMVEIAKSIDEGYIQYKWQLTDDSTQILPKISFIKAFTPWGWIVGTGVYIDDIQEEIATMKRKLLGVSLLITLLVLFIFLYAIKKGLIKEKHLKEIEIKYKKLFDEANDGILILKDRVIIECNTKALKLFGSKRSEIIGKRIIDLSPEYQDDGESSDIKSRKIVNDCLDGVTQYFEWKHVTIESVPFIAEISLFNVEINDEILIISFIRDITKRKSDENKLIKAMEKAEVSDKLKTAFLANMSHEIRTPMNGILGFAHLIQENDIEVEKRNEFLKIILSKGNQLLQIINDIIDISKIESNQIVINYTDFSLNDLLDELSLFFSIENANVELKISKELTNYNDYIHSDYNRLTQVLTNLLSNAFKFTESGYVELGYKVNKHDLYLYVKDTGIGVNKKDRKIIFDRFRQSDDSLTRKYGGTGLGLSISKGLVTLLKGTIGVESDGENGSVFYLTIPYTQVKSKANNVKPISNLETDWSSKKIMVVEDDEMSFKFIKEVLRDTKVELMHVKSGLNAIELLKKINIDLILMDIQLPGIDGNDTTKEIRKFNTSIPIIAQTANAMADDKDKSLLAGCNDYLAKPIDGNELINTIKSHL
ncbi:MAG: response regulator [Bacteroidales bacterium]|nr:response regulator [Bacteroidales bacterium]